MVFFILHAAACSIDKYNQQCSADNHNHYHNHNHIHVHLTVRQQVLDEDGDPFDMDELSVETSVKPLKIYLMSTNGGEDLLLEVPDASLAFEWVYAFQQHIRFVTMHPGMQDPNPSLEEDSGGTAVLSRGRSTSIR